MLDGLTIGEKVLITYEVKSEDCPDFDGQVIHKVCSTYVLAREIEWTSRQFVLKYKLDSEEGIGTKLTIEHLSPALVGDMILIEAEVKEINNNELICSYIAKVGERKVAIGETGQKVLKKDALGKIFSKFGDNE